jgi:hypothetical protein
VVGQEDVDGHTTERVELSFARAAPLFPFLRLGGTWRPMFEGDRVVLWLDATGWYPVRFEVFPSTDPERRAWEMRFGLPHERPDTAIMDVELQSVSSQPPDTSPSSVLVYAAGLDYLRISEDPSWTGPGPFGPVDATAQRVELPGGGAALYEPAGDGLGRRLAIHGGGTDLFLETNLPRDELLSIAATLPVRARPLPEAWRSPRVGALTIEQVPPAAALGDVGLTSVPDGLPDGYTVANATRTLHGGSAIATTITFRQRETDTAGSPITLHVSRSGAAPHSTAPDQVLVSIGTATGRWTPSDALLEWEAGGSARSLQGDVGLGVLVAIATSMTRSSR